MRTLAPEERATRSARAMWEDDSASQAAGIEWISIIPGASVCRLEVSDRHTNGHQICHGGYIFMLADTAFALACNSYNRPAVAQHNSISFLSPGSKGDLLTATATEISKTKRSGIYDVTVVNQTGATIALFRGHSRIIPGQWFDEDQVASAADPSD